MYLDDASVTDGASPSKNTEDSFEQDEKASLLISNTELGMVIVERLVQLEKARNQIEVIELGRLTLDRLVQKLNAQFPI